MVARIELHVHKLVSAIAALVGSPMTVLVAFGVWELPINATKAVFF